MYMTNGCQYTACVQVLYGNPQLVFYLCVYTHMYYTKGQIHDIIHTCSLKRGREEGGGGRGEVSVECFQIRGIKFLRLCS